MIEKEALKKKLKPNIFLKRLFNLLKKAGIEIHRYYFIKEGFFHQKELSIKPRLTPVEFVFLKSDDIIKLSENQENDYSEKEMINMMLSGCQCVGLKHYNEIVAYTWYNLKRVDSTYFTCPLKSDEAYIYGARTLNSYRGKGLAPYLRSELHKHLHGQSRQNIYSIILYSNKNAIRLKNKLNAKTLKLCLHFCMLKKFKANICLKNIHKRKDLMSKVFLMVNTD